MLPYLEDFNELIVSRKTAKIFIVSSKGNLQIFVLFTLLVNDRIIGKHSDAKLIKKSKE